MPGLGHKSYVQFGGREATYGTFVAPTQKLEIINWNITPTVGVINDTSLYGQPSKRALYQGGLLYRGTFLCRLNYEGFEELFRNAWGTYSNTIVTGTTRDHFFREGPTLTPMSIEVNLGDVPTAGKVFRLLGAKLTAMTIRGTAGSGNDGMLTVEFTVLAKDYVSDQTPTAAVTHATVAAVTATGVSSLTRATGSFITDTVAVGDYIIHPGVWPGTRVLTVAALLITTSAPAQIPATVGQAVFLTVQAPQLLPVLFSHSVAASISDGTTDAASSVRVRSFEVTLESPHHEDRYFFGGGLNIDEPIRSDFLTARFRLTQEFTTKAQHDAARAFTKGSPKLLFRHPEALQSADFREFEIRCSNANMVEFGAPVEGFGIIMSTATWEGIFDPTDATALFARFRNALPALP